MERPQGTKALAQGLEILRILSESADALSATAVAERLGISVSTASRALGALTAAGYVVKPDYHHFAPSIGVMTLAAHAREHFALPAAVRDRLSAAARATNCLWTVGTVHQHQVIYLLRVGAVHEAVELAVGRYPLHISVVGLRALLLLDESVAIDFLQRSRRVYGWDRPTHNVPETEANLLAAARAACRADGILCLDNWRTASECALAAPIPQLMPAAEAAGDQPLIVALVGGPHQRGAMLAALQAEMKLA